MAFGRMGMVLAGVLALAIELTAFVVSPRAPVHVAERVIR